MLPISTKLYGVISSH